MDNLTKEEEKELVNLDKKVTKTQAELSKYSQWLNCGCRYRSGERHFGSAQPFGGDTAINSDYGY